ncbi:MAG: nucleotidyl transferase [Gammaproteobacteria bacterium]|nr:nucleotidyl transferase [Gammaproteobacteria bacterium]
MKVMILAAGYGKRMLPITKDTPKPLLKVSNKTLIQRNIEILINSGFNEIVINIAYLGSMIIEHVTKCFPSADIKFSKEENPLGTGGGVMKALDILGKDPFLLINSDIFHDINIKDLKQYTEKAHIVGVSNPNHNLNGDFSLDGNKVVIKKDQNDLTWSGISIINPCIFDDVKKKEGAFDMWNSVLKKHIQNQCVTGEVTKRNWIDTGTIERLELANNFYKDEN